MRRARRSLAASVVGVAAVAMVGVVPAEVAAAAPSLTVSPAADLVDGQRVTVSGSGFPADDFLLLAQCPSDVTSLFDAPCRYASGQSDANGDLGSTVVVRAVLDAERGIDCRVLDSCVLVAAVYDDASDDYRELARTALPFDPGGPLAPLPAVSVVPSEGLVDGQRVDVTGSGALGDGVEIVQCTAEPAGWDDCDWETSSFASSPEGSFAATLQVFAVVVTDNGGQVDCRTAGRCVLAVVGDSGNWDDTTSVPLAFAPDGPLLPPPILTVTPPDGLVDGQTVQIAGQGFTRRYDGETVQVHQCAPDPAPDRCRTSFDRYVPVDEQGGFTLTMPVTARVPTSEGPHDCRTGTDPCSLVATTSSVDSPRAGRTDLRFDPDAPLLPDPSIAVEPAAGLADFTPLAVSGDHFTPGSRVTVQVCRSGAADPTGEACDGTNGESPTADAHGAIATEIAVFAASDGGTGEPDRLDCRTAPGCEVVATDEARGLSARHPLEFGPPDVPRGRYRDPVFDDVEVTRDVVYRQTVDHAGNPVELALDIYLPAGDTATERPAIVWMYGGWFAFGDKQDGYIVDFATESARRGYVGIAINYRERPNTQGDLGQLWAALIDAYDDAVAAVEWVQAHADDYGVDPDAIAASGWSAGGVTSLNLAYMPGDRGPSTSPIAAALPVAGVLVAGIDPGEPPSQVFFATHDSTLPDGANNTDTVCLLAQAVGTACELVSYDGADHGIISRSQDILRRGTDFLVDQVLVPHGYFAVTADAGGPDVVDEGSTVTLDGAGSTGAGLSYAWSPSSRVDSPASSTPTLRGLDDGTETITLDVTNLHGITTGDTVEVTTRNVAPTITSARTDNASGSRAVSLAATISDPGTADTHTADVDWGDGHTETAIVTVDPSTGKTTVSADHDYATAGPYQVVLTVVDDDHGTTTWSSTVNVGCSLSGTDYADVLIGTRTADTICGLGGNDIIVGAAGNDILLGGPGNDLLTGGPGDDVIDGQAGWDLAIGGPGTNTCTGEIRLTCRRSRPPSGR